MSSLEHAQLSALSDAATDLADRVATLAVTLEEGQHSDVANALYEAERSLAMAGRSIERARGALTG